MARTPKKPDVIFLSDNRPVDRRAARALGVPEARLAPLSQLNSFPHLRALPVEEVWLPLDLGDHWRACYRLAVQGGAVVVGEVRVFPRETGASERLLLSSGQWSAEMFGSSATVPPGGITARLLRQVRVGEHHRVADKIVRQVAGDPHPLAQDAAARHGLTTLGPTGARRGRPRKPDFFYAQVADRYEAALKRGSRRPAEDVADAMGVSGGQVRQWLYAARDRGLLTRAPRYERVGQQGVKGGSLTPRARALLSVAPSGATRKGVKRERLREESKQIRAKGVRKTGRQVGVSNGKGKKVKRRRRR